MADTKTPQNKRLGFEPIFRWVESLPGPYLLYYLLGYLLTVAGFHAFLWSDGTLPAGEFSQTVLFAETFWTWIQLAAYHYCHNQAAAALTRFRPVLDVGEERFQEIKSSFLTFSRKGFFLLVLLSYLTNFDYLLDGQGFPPEYVANWGTRGVFLLIMLLVPVALGFLVFVLRSLVWINRLYALVPKISLFDQQPLYALSAYTSRVGIVFIFFLLFSYLQAQVTATVDGDSQFYAIFFSLLAILVFVLPLWGVHTRLVRAKEDALSKSNQLIDKHYAEILQDVEAGKTARLADLRMANSALLEHRQELTKISTWPWDTTTLRTFLTALFVPMTIWLIQQLLLGNLLK